MLVIANETVLGEPLLAAIRARAGTGPASFLVLSPRATRRRASTPRPTGGSAAR